LSLDIAHCGRQRLDEIMFGEAQRFQQIFFHGRQQNWVASCVLCIRDYFERDGFVEGLVFQATTSCKCSA